jgi:hypothetical protein
MSHLSLRLQHWEKLSGELNTSISASVERTYGCSSLWGCFDSTGFQLQWYKRRITTLQIESNTDTSLNLLILICEH